MRKGDKDVKKEAIKTSERPLDFQEKNLLMKFLTLNTSRTGNLSKIEPN
jgi:hypothetical protein